VEKSVRRIHWEEEEKGKETNESGVGTVHDDEAASGDVAVDGSKAAEAVR
jgi:hypothetical protein